MVQCEFHWLYRVFEKELYNGIPNVTVWRMLRRRLQLKEYKDYRIGFRESAGVFQKIFAGATKVRLSKRKAFSA
jgi:hypothetical protein